jgi:hypothetical protein
MGGRRFIPLAFLCFAATVALAGDVPVSPAPGSSSVESSGDIRVTGLKSAPANLAFACCDGSVDQAETLFSNPSVLSDLKALSASVAVAIMDFSPGRAQLVRRLNAAGIPMIAWLALPEERGYYLNADNARLAVNRYAEFKKWTNDNGLLWTEVGLDIEPTFNELRPGGGHKWHLAGLLIRRCFDFARMRRAREAYTTLIRRIQSDGYPVQTYQLPLIAAERRAHTTLAERLLGIVDVRGNLEFLKLYTSFTPELDSALIWKLGPDAQGIAVGSTSAEGSPTALDWEQFSRDLIVAHHFTAYLGVYNLEGCVRQGFLSRLRTMDWGQTVTIPAEAIRRANRLRLDIQISLWIASRILYFVAAILAIFAWWMWRRAHRPSDPSGRLAAEKNVPVAQ